MDLNVTLSHDLIRANAGTGKTFQLTNRFLALVLRGHSPDTILATTFTRKAASEIRERVFRRLLEAMNSRENALTLGLHLGIQKLTVAQCESALLSLLASQHRLRIGTIDALFMEIARLFFLESGLPARWEISSVADDRGALTEALLSTLEDLGSEDDLGERCAKIIGQRAASVIIRPLLRHLRPSLELSRSSSPTVWDVPLVTGEPTPLPSFTGAIHSMPIPLTKGPRPTPFALWVTARENLLSLTEAANPLGVLDETVIKKILDESPTYARAQITDSHRSVLMPLARASIDALLLKTSSQTAALRRFLDNFRCSLDAIKFRTNRYSFDDIKHILRFASSRITEMELFFRLDSSIRHLLIDEFQDTSLDQWQVLEPLVSEILSVEPGERTFLCVGDEKQSIYDWRGGTPHLFAHLETRYESLRSTPLSRSFRSSRAIMELVNQVLERAPYTPAVSAHPTAAAEWIARITKHETALDSPGYVRIERFAAKGNADLDDSCEDAEGVHVDGTGINRAVALVEEIRAAQPRATIGVLLRRNKFQPAILAELISRGIGASGEGGTPLTSSPIVRSLLALLTWIEHPADTIARFQVWNSPIRSCYRALSKDKGSDDGGSDDFVSPGSDGLGCFDEGLFLAAEREQIWREGIGSYLTKVLARVGIEGGVEASLIDHFLDTAFRFDGKSRFPEIDRFIEEIRSTSVSLESQAAVRVMTIHKAKGLEFDAVILLDLEQPVSNNRGTSLLAERQSRLDAPTAVWIRPRSNVIEHHPRLAKAEADSLSQEISGQLALLYVAITRPRHALFVLLSDKIKSTSLNELLTQSLPPAPSTDSPLSSDLEVKPLDQGALTIVYEGGNLDWFPATSSQITPFDRERIVFHPLFRPPTGTHRRALLAQTPSTRGISSRFLDTIASKDPAALQFGIAVHAICESIEWLPPLPTPLQLESLPAADTLAQTYLLDRLSLPEIRTLFDYDAVRKQLGGERGDANDIQLELWRERPFALRLGGKVVAGVFDRVVIARTPDGAPLSATIYDFKTDRISATTAPTHAARYQNQLALYRSALLVLLGLREGSQRGGVAESKVSAELVLLDPGVVVKVV